MRVDDGIAVLRKQAAQREDAGNGAGCRRDAVIPRAQRDQLLRRLAGRILVNEVIELNARMVQAAVVGVDHGLHAAGGKLADHLRNTHVFASPDGR